MVKLDSRRQLLFVDKERVPSQIDQRRKTLADVDYLDLELIENIVNSFDNPKLPNE